MKSIFRLVISTCLVFLLSEHGMAEAPVVNDSENFALLEQQTTNKSSVADQGNYDDGEPALARDANDASAESNDVALINKIQGLQQDIQELRGQLEMQAHNLKVLQEQQFAFYNDLDARLTGRTGSKAAKHESVPPPLDIDAKPAVMQHADARSTATNPAPIEPNITQTASQPVTAVGAVAAVTETNSNPADEQISYLKAYEFVKNKQYDEAMLAMQSFTQKYPQSGYTANAEYWLGELYLIKRDYAVAMNHFSTVLQQYPSSNKYAASLLKMGYALADAGRLAEAKERLHEVMNKYPDTGTANLARLKLETLGG